MRWGFFRCASLKFITLVLLLSSLLIRRKNYYPCPLTFDEPILIMKKVLAVFLVILGVSHVQAGQGTAKFFCAIPDSNVWSWLKFNNEIFTAEGEWIRDTRISDSVAYAFKIAEYDYSTLNRICHFKFSDEYTAYPKNFTDESSAFLVERGDGSQYLTDRFETTTN